MMPCPSSSCLYLWALPWWTNEVVSTYLPCEQRVNGRVNHLTYTIEHLKHTLTYKLYLVWTTNHLLFEFCLNEIITRHLPTITFFINNMVTALAIMSTKIIMIFAEVLLMRAP